MAISAMPPLNGFFSEWITFQSLFNGIWTSGTYATWAFLLATAALALTSGLALACFVKAFGITFLARPRSVAAKKAKESSRLMQVGMIGMAGVCVIIGLCAAPVVVLLKETAQQAMGLNVASSVGASQLHTITFNSGTTSVSGPITAVLLLIAGLAVWLAVRYGVNRKQKVSTADTWDCGTPLTSRMEITATGFSRSIILIFRGILRPSLQNDIEYDDAASRYTPKSRTVSTQIRDTYQDLIYRPVYDGLIRVSRWIKTIQNGNLNVYILYVFAALIIVLVMGV
jgi:hydrogenase-4 component B